MPTTRRQTAIAEGKINPTEQVKAKKKRSRSSTSQRKVGKHHGDIAENGVEEDTQQGYDQANLELKEKELDVEDGPASKKLKMEEAEETKGVYKVGIIERGHIYFFYRPRVQLEEAHSIDDVKNFHMLLVPRPPDFAASSSSNAEKVDPSKREEAEMKMLAPGADAVPAPDEEYLTKKHFRLVTIGKKRLPDPQSPGANESRRKELFWATVTAVGDDLTSLGKGLGEKSYETKTQGTRHEAPARLVGRGGYAIVNSEAKMPSKRETHLGYHLSHPPPTELGEVQESLGIYSASSFILQVKNPLAPATGPLQAHSKAAEYPQWIMHDVFGSASKKGNQSRGRESYGLRFASCETPELLDFEGAQLLLIASREGEEGLEASLGEGRGTALKEMEEREASEPFRKVFDEIGLDLETFPVESLEGSWI